MNPENDSYVALFSSIPMFRHLKPEHLEFLNEHAVQRTFWPGERAIEQGARGDDLFVILDGEFKIVVLHEEIGFEREIGRLQPPDFFGESAILSGQNGAASVVAVTAATAVAINGKVLRELIAAWPDLTFSVCAGMAQQLEEFKRREAVVTFVKLDDFVLSKTQQILPAKISKSARSVVLAQNAGTVKVGMVDPYDNKVRNFLREELRQYTVEFAAIGEQDFNRYAEEFLKSEAKVSAKDEPSAVIYVDPSGKEHGLGDHQTADVLEKMFLKAIKAGASDLHFEPAEPASRVRMRLDGNMVALESEISNGVFPKLISRLKVISDMDITNRRLPQDGRFPIRIGNQRVEVRVSITPCQGGEKAALRILDQSRQRLDLQELILSKPMCDAMREVLRNSSGMILVTGPTGSGKTTTLYSSLSEIWRATQKVNIVTIEDPVEYQLSYATQVQINRSVGLDFAQILRTALRQDPDVILVGEIRDRDSASIALETATTGHLVLSSLHTDSTLEALFRLRKLEVKPYLMASALKCIVSQRLAARICQHCTVDVPANDPEAQALRTMKILPEGWSGGLFRGKGCNLCRFGGEQGRVGVFEMLMINETLRELIEKDASFAELSASLTRDSYISMSFYSRFLLSQGLVSPEQLRAIFPRYSLLNDGVL